MHGGSGSDGSVLQIVREAAPAGVNRRARFIDSCSMTLQFFLTEIVARLVAIYLCADSIGILQRAFAERKIEYVETDVMNMVLGWSNWIAHRDTMPLRYWAIVAGHVTAVAACLVVAIFGWWAPAT